MQKADHKPVIMQDPLITITGFSFGLLIISTIAFLLMANSTLSPEQRRLFLCGGFCAALLLLIAFRFLTDRIACEKVRANLLRGAFVLVLLAVALQMFFENNTILLFVSVIFLVSALCVNMVLWFCFLSSLEHKKLIFNFDICFGFATVGLFFAVFGVFSAMLFIVASALLFFLLFQLVIEPKMKELTFPSKKDTKANYYVVKTARSTIAPLIAVGILVGFPIVYSVLNFDTFTLFVLIAISLILACILFGFLKAIFKYKVENFLYNYTSVFFCVGEFLLPFSSGIARTICVLYLLTFAFIQVFISSGAILETARLFRVSTIWLLSTQFTKLFFGLAISMALTVVINAYLDWNMAAIAEVFIVSFLVIFLTCFVKKTRYPNPDSVQADNETPGKQHYSKWSDALNVISSKFGLSPREREVLMLFSKGHSSTAIAKSLFISISTTRTHIANIYNKLDIHSKEELLELLQCERDSQKL